MTEPDVLNLQHHTVRLAPTPTGYALSLILLIEKGDAVGRAWAKAEIIKLVKAAATITPEAWAEEEEAG